MRKMEKEEESEESKWKQEDNIKHKNVEEDGGE
jgi:hypothetical protein